MSVWRRSDAPRRGVATVWVALLLLVLVGLVGLGVDAGYVLLGAHRLQNAADAAALAAAQKVGVDQVEARTAAINCAMANVAAGRMVLLAANDANDPAGDIVVGRYDRQAGLFTATTESPNAVRVVARRVAGTASGPAPLIFGRIFGVEGVDVARQAVAMTGGEIGAGVIALDEDAPRAVWLNGNGTLTVIDGAIHVNSSDNQALRANGNPVIDAETLQVVGDVWLGGGQFDGELTTGVPLAADPLESIPGIDYSGMGDLGAVTAKKGTTVLDPGYYSGGVRGSGGDLVMNPGLYVLGGAGLDLSGKGDVTANGVMFYIVGSGSIDLTGQGRVTLTPPDPSLHAYIGVETYAGISIFQARENASEAKITGNGQLDLAGTLYLPKAHLKMAGNGDILGNQLIVNTVKISGNGEVVIDYDGRFPLAGRRVFLVE